MRVLHLGSELTWRGGEQQQFYLIEQLKDQVTNFVGCRPGSEMERRCQTSDITTFQIGFRGTQVTSAREIKDICLTESIDLIHCHTARAHGAAFFSALIFGNKTPIVVSKRTDFPVKKSYIGRLKYNHPTIRKILCVSDKIKDIVQAGIERPEIVETIYSGVDPNKFNVAQDSNFRRNFNLANNDILIGNTSALAEHKDYFTFLKVAKEVSAQRKNVKFLIIGDGPLRENVYAFSNQLGLNKSVVFTGFLNNIPEILPQLDLFFMPSKEEGLGTSLLDAMVCKVPIVTTRAGGIPEIVLDGKTGFCGEIGNVTMLSQMILKILDDKEIASKLVENAYEMVVQKFNRNITAQKTFNIYREVLEGE